MEKLFQVVDQRLAGYLEQLKAFLSMPSVSADPENKAITADTARWLADHLKSIGFPTAEIYPTEGHPILFAHYPGPAGAPTLLIYGHYDVQPVDPLNEWVTPPFQPDIREGRIYARGASDDKGQLFAHIKAVETVLRETGSLPVSIKLLFEGEEEVGSEALGKWLPAHKDLLACDVLLISDGGMIAKGQPSIDYGLRGLVYMQVEVEAAKSDLHSGSFGGAVANPINVLADILTSMKDKKNRVKIAGFYDDVLPISPEEKANYAKLPHSDKQFLKDTGAPKLFGEKGYTTLERKSARPTLDANGIWGGFAGEGAKTVLPARAGAKVSMRLVPNQDPKKISDAFRAHVAKVAPKAVRVKVSEFQGGLPFICPLTDPALQKAAQALTMVFGKECLFGREGGSIPIVADFSALLKAPVVLMGFGLPNENAHAPNENFDLDNFSKGIKSSIAYMHLLAEK
jgi:acetylornithine deacetylase/succinyl-diaminopimelate desuccinylase-like protein